MLPGLGDSPDVSPTQNPGPISARNPGLISGELMFWRISSADPTRRSQRNGPSVQGYSRHRPVRHSPEPPDSGLHQSLSGPECPSPGRSQHRLEHFSSGLRLSTDAHLAEGPTEDSAVIGRHHTGGSGVADSVLVSGSTQSLHGSSTRDSGCSRPLADGATQDLDALQPRNVQLPRLDVVRDSLKVSLRRLPTESQFHNGERPVMKVFYPKWSLRIVLNSPNLHSSISPSAPYRTLCRRRCF